MKYNKKNQPFTVLSRFRVLESSGEIEYCRIQFHATGHVTHVPAMIVNSLDFEDDSIIVEEKFIEADDNVVVEEIESISLPEIEEAVTVEDPEEKIVAINPKGKEIVVKDLETFVKGNNLDLESVLDVLAGNQKTHKKWRFTKA